MGMGPERTYTLILEIGGGVVGLGIALITGGMVGVLLVRRQYGALVPLGLVLAAVALLLWWQPVIRVELSFALLLIGYTWLVAWWRATLQGSDRHRFDQSGFVQGDTRSSRTRVRTRADGSGRAHRPSTTRAMLEGSHIDETSRLTGRVSWEEDDPHDQSE